MSAVDIDDLKTWIGRKESATDALDTRLVASFLAALDRDPSGVREGDEAPLCIHWCLAPAIVKNSATGPDGHPARGGFLPPVPLPRRMWAGGELRFQAPLKVGDTVTRKSTIEAVEQKEGRTGQLIFVTVRHAIVTERGQVIDERQDLVYREAETTASPPSNTAPPDAQASDITATFDPSPLALFRYSALTYNGHRIHYDRRYACEEEGYGGLVVHGPLQATLLCHLAAEALERPPQVFSYRGLRPVFDGAPLGLNAKRADNRCDLWSSGGDALTRMRATAS